MTLPRRSSRLREGVTLLVGDLHNHSLMSDGAGDPDTAFAQLRAAGLDVAALTDHAAIPRQATMHLDPADYPDREALRIAQLPPDSFDAASWARTGELADAADEPGVFTAIRGFEWTEPWVGHANVWFSGGYRDVHLPGRVTGLHDWLAADAPDALFGYNHPGREGGRFDAYRFDARLASRLVTLEMFNRFDEYLCVGGRAPLVDCLATGWRPGVIGVSDEHGRRYGLAGKGRTGIWAASHDRAGVRAALLARSTYATREVGLLLDATRDGVPMGGVAAGTEVTVDLDTTDPLLAGREVLLQLLAPGLHDVPVVVAQGPARVGAESRLRAEPDDAPWWVLRVADAAPAALGTVPRGRSLAYASPWWSLSPAAS